MDSIPKKYLDRAFSHSYRDGDCLISRYSKNNRGYPSMWVTFPNGSRRNMSVHRLSWVRAYGPIPDGMTVDHKECNRPDCLEPTHLQLLTLSQNKIKSDASGDWEPGTCKRGHPDSYRRAVTCRRPNGEPYETTVCSECVRERGRERYARVQSPEYPN